MSLSQTVDLSKLSDDNRAMLLDGLIGAGIDGVFQDNGTLLVRAADQSALEAALEFVDAMRRTYRLVARKVLKSHASGPRVGCTDEALAASPDLHFFDEGLTGISGNLLGAYRFFEAQFKTFADEFGAAEQHYPVMLPTKLLQEVDYFSNFPQHVTLCSHFHDELPVLEQVAREAKANPDDLAEKFGAALDTPSHVLTPAVCLPCYSQHKGHRIPLGGVTRLTMQNHVFRYEAKRFQPLSRGWDFSVRDLVFFGSSAELTRLRADVMERAFALCETLDLDASLELANDPFFLDTSRDKVVYQRLAEAKYELLFAIPGRQTPLAASSFNLHRDHYTGVYDIAFEDGEQAESACMGFGLERWLYAFVRQRGLDPEHWPDAVRAFCND